MIDAIRRGRVEAAVRTALAELPAREIETAASVLETRTPFRALRTLA